MIVIRYLVLLALFIPSTGFAFDIDTEGRLKAGSRYIFDSPAGFSDFDSEIELRLGVLGNAWEKDEWTLDYELSGDVVYVDGPREEVGLAEEFDADFFRAWLRLDNGTVKVRGGRQKILFGSGALFRPLGFFDTRIVSGIVPETRGVDGVRITYFPSDTSSLETWAVPAKLGTRVITGIRGERQFGPVEAGAVVQHHPKSDLDDLPNFNQEMVQLGLHLKGEYGVGLWNESRLDIEQGKNENPLRFETVFGTDFTFDVGQGLHVLVEYFLTTSDADFTPTDFKGDRTIHQLGFQIDQPVGIDIVWRVFAFYDLKDKSYQAAPQIEYAFNDQIFLYLLGNYGNNFGGDNRTGRLFRDLPVFTGTESSIGVALVAYM